MISQHPHLEEDHLISSSYCATKPGLGFVGEGMSELWLKVRDDVMKSTSNTVIASSSLSSVTQTMIITTLFLYCQTPMA